MCALSEASSRAADRRPEAGDRIGGGALGHLLTEKSYRDGDGVHERRIGGAGERREGEDGIHVSRSGRASTENWLAAPPG